MRVTEIVFSIIINIVIINGSSSSSSSSIFVLLLLLLSSLSSSSSSYPVEGANYQNSIKTKNIFGFFCVICVFISFCFIFCSAFFLDITSN